MTYRISITTTLLALTLAIPLAASEHTKDSIDKIKASVAEKKAVIVDVREQGEWDEGHLKAAVLVPLSELKSEAAKSEYAKKLAEKLPKDKVVYCHCKAGKRALLAGDLLKKLGYDARPLKQGYQQLLEAGFPKAELK